MLKVTFTSISAFLSVSSKDTHFSTTLRSSLIQEQNGS